MLTFKKIFLLLSLIILTSCGGISTGGGGKEDQPEGFQVINAAPNYHTLDVSLGEAPIMAQVNYGESTGYLEAPEGDEVALRIKTEKDVLPSISESLTIDTGKSYTYLVTEADKVISGTLLEDNNDDPETSLFKIRFVNIGLTNTNIDIYVTQPEQKIKDVSPIVSALEFKKSSDYQSIDKGTYRIRITEEGKTKVLYDSGEVSFKEGSIFTVAFFEKEHGGTPFFGTILKDK